MDVCEPAYRWRRFVSYCLAKTLDGSLKDGIAVLLVLIGDVVNGTSDFLHLVR